MDIIRIFFAAFCCVLVAGVPSAWPTKTIQQKDLEALEKETEAVPPVELLKEITLIHKYNDTDAKKGNQSVFSKINSFGGLENRIQNLGGVQKIILNNKIQYNFLFWLVPKNFTRHSETREKRGTL